MPENFRKAFAAAGLLRELPPLPTEPPPLPDLPLGHPPPAALPDGALASDEIAAGIAVLRMDMRLLDGEKRVCGPDDAMDLKLARFVCLGVDGDESTWAALVRRLELERLLLIAPSWRRGGNAKWRTGRLSLDARSIWRGPRDAFASAAWRDAYSNVEERARLTAGGLAAVRGFIDRRS